MGDLTEGVELVDFSFTFGHLFESETVERPGRMLDSNITPLRDNTCAESLRMRIYMQTGGGVYIRASLFYIRAAPGAAYTVMLYVILNMP